MSSYLGKVEKTPCDDAVVVKGHVEGDDGATDADAGQEGRHLVPDSDGALPQPLPDGQLQVEHGDPFDGEHDEVGHEAGS